MLKVSKITTDSENKCISLLFSNGEYANLHKFGYSIYSIVSDNVLKSSLSEIKEDCLQFFRGKKDINQIKRKYIL